MIQAGETVNLTKALPRGIPTANNETIRVYAVCRINGTVPVTVFINALEDDELIFPLDSITVEPGKTITRTYSVPARALVVFAQAAEGTGSSGLDFGVLGFGPCAFEML